MATYKPIRKTASGTEEIKIPYAVLADPPDISGLMPKSGGTFTGVVTFNKQINLGQGDANCLYLGTDGRVNGPENRTLFGLVSGTATFGHTAYALAFRGSGTRPKFNGNDLALKSDIPTTPDTSNLAKLDAENTFTKGQVITGGTSGGYSIDANGYIRGSWLQASSTANKGLNTGKVCVFDDNGWIYYRTPSEILSEASGVPKSAFSLSGTTLTITI